MAIASTKTDFAPPIKPSRKRCLYYPVSDGKPMAETDKHRKLMTYDIDGLDNFYRHRSDVYVSGSNFLYWEEGNPKARVSPDCYVIFGVAKKLRDSYKAWEEGGHLP